MKYQERKESETLMELDTQDIFLILKIIYYWLTSSIFQVRTNFMKGVIWAFAPFLCDSLHSSTYCSSQAAAAAAKSLQSCPTPNDPMDCSPPGFPVPGFLQARTLEWVAIAFSNAWKWKWSLSVVSNSSPPHGLQPTRLLHPWDSPGKSTGVSCHCLLQWYQYYYLNFSEGKLCIQFCIHSVFLWNTSLRPLPAQYLFYRGENWSKNIKDIHADWVHSGSQWHSCNLNSKQSVQSLNFRVLYPSAHHWRWVWWMKKWLND